VTKQVNVKPVETADQVDPDVAAMMAAKMKEKLAAELGEKPEPKGFREVQATAPSEFKVEGGKEFQFGNHTCIRQDF